jgi:3-phenylpropionate/trans-cinnamate dioxygenase ferredoxin subunit
MTNFIETVSFDRLKPGTSLVVEVAGNSVALFNVDGTIYAIADSCAHAGASLAAGRLDGKIVTCRAHGLKYDVTTGYVGGTPGFGVDSYAVEVVDGMIRIAAEPKPNHTEA